ncbi:MAG: hypothetical protein Ct9H300mP16_05400 [Pseudomonadota bacterium]|nr:MAG: hypothetical protein Ct9H300mP16_05400 [Pseudomonadota bacterium]
MTQNPHLDVVTQFYDTHPISEQQVLKSLAQDDVDLSSLDQGTLQNYDQDHFGGPAATDTLAHLANIGQSDHVIDVCCGLGGPARYLAYHYGCRVTGIDLNWNRIDGAQRLTGRVGLEDQVSFQGPPTPSITSSPEMLLMRSLHRRRSAIFPTNRDS